MDLVRSWWEWCTESFGHMFLGVTAPILLIGAIIVLIGASGSGSLPQPPRSEIAGVCLDTTSGGGGGACVTPGEGGSGPLTIDTATPVPPTATPAPRTYEVQSGDALSLICANEVPEMPVDQCISRTVALSKLGGPDELVAGQTLSLPGTADPNATPRPRPTATPEVTESAPEPEEAEEVTHAGEDQASDAEPEADEETYGGEGSAGEEASVEGTPEASFVPLLGSEQQEQEPAAEAESTPAESTPDPDIGLDVEIEGAKLYTVEEGDSVLSICVDQVPDMDPDECVQFVVLLNELDGPDEIYANQGLVLP